MRAGRIRMDPANAPVVLAAHPDDETIGVGALLSHLPGSVVIHTTDGAAQGEGHGFASQRERGARQAYAQTRRVEVVHALALAGVTANRVHCLGANDQEASFHLAPLSLRLVRFLHDLHPRMLVTHSYEGGHPDHDATAFIAHAAVALLRRSGGEVPTRLEMTSYNAGSRRLAVADFLQVCDAAAPPLRDDGVVEHVLAPEERDLKRRMFACFETQRRLLESFPLTIERVRPAPAYAFGRAPHVGLLHYETLKWQLTGDRWRRLAGAAQAELGLSSGPL